MVRKMAKPARIRDLAKFRSEPPRGMVYGNRFMLVLDEGQSWPSFVYEIMEGDELIYIGQTANPPRRMASHRSQRSGRSISYGDIYQCDRSVAHFFERYAIKRLRPLENKEPIRTLPFRYRPPTREIVRLIKV